jgi:hypothetical protein
MSKEVEVGNRRSKVEKEKKEKGRKETKTENLLRLKVYAMGGGEIGADEFGARVVLRGCRLNLMFYFNHQGAD